MFQYKLNSQTKGIGSAAFILGLAYLVSAFLGLLRDRLLARSFGIGDELDIYYAAFKIPDFIAMILIIGAISAAIVPIFSQHLSYSKEEAWKFASVLLNLFLVFLSAIVIFLMIFTPYLISLVAPGFEGEKKELAIVLTRIMLLSPIILGISNMISGILQVFQRFFVTALSPILYNIGIIIGILFFVPLFGISGLAWGVVLGGFLHLIIQLPVFFNIGFRFQKVFNFKHPGVLKALKLMLPRSFGLAASQINLIVMTAIASTLVSGSIAVFNLANNLISILMGLIAVPFATAVFPVLSLKFFENDKKDFAEKFSLVFRRIVFLVVPLSFLFFILRAHIVRIIYDTGQFGISDIRLTAATLGLFSFGILAQGLIILVSKTFFAVQNTRIPAFVSFFTVALNIILAFWFVGLLKTSGNFNYFLSNILKLDGLQGIEILALPLALSLSAFFQLFLLLFFLRKVVESIKFKEIWNSFIKVLLAGLLMSFFVYYGSRILSLYLDTQSFFGVFWQIALSSTVGVSIYILLAYLFRFLEFRNIEEFFNLTFYKKHNGRKE